MNNSQISEEIETILSKPSHKERFLTKTEEISFQEFKLPYKLQDLFEIFQHLDHYLFLYTHRCKSTFANTLFKTLKKIVKREVKMKDL